MKTLKAPIIIVVVALVLSVLFLHPMRIFTESTTRFNVYITLTKTRLHQVTYKDGGYRCYIGEDEYFWISKDQFESKSHDGIPYVEWKFPWGKNVLYRRMQ